MERLHAQSKNFDMGYTSKSPPCGMGQESNTVRGQPDFLRPGLLLQNTKRGKPVCPNKERATRERGEIAYYLPIEVKGLWQRGIADVQLGEGGSGSPSRTGHGQRSSTPTRRPGSQATSRRHTSCSIVWRAWEAERRI